MTAGKSDNSPGAWRLTITMGDDQRGQVELIARRRRTSAASVIRWAIDAYVAKELGAGDSSSLSDEGRPS